MKKPKSEQGVETNAEDDDDMLPEYDFGGGVRGKYFQRAIEGRLVVVLDPDVAVAFPNAESVNRALRLLVEVARNEESARVLAEQKESYKTE